MVRKNHGADFGTKYLLSIGLTNAFEAGLVSRGPRSKRREVFDWMEALAARILVSQEDTSRLSVDDAWRIAAQAWLHRNDVISVAKPKNCR